MHALHVLWMPFFLYLYYVHCNSSAVVYPYENNVDSQGMLAGKIMLIS